MAGMGQQLRCKMADRWWLLLPRLMLFCGIGIAVASCSNGGRSKVEGYSPRVVAAGQPIPVGGGRQKLGKPYVVGGKIYTPRHDPTYSRTGIASWYGKDFHGRLTANGEIYDMHRLSAAHPTLPLPSLVEVTNVRTGQQVVVRVNDRGPFVQGRIIDLSYQAAAQIGIIRGGVGEVHVRYIGPAQL